MRAGRDAAAGAAYADELWEKTKADLAGMSDIRMDLNLHSWEGYTEEPVLDPFSRQTGANVNPQMLISDPAAVNNLRGGGTSTWDVINLNNSWQRNQLFPEGLITPLDKDKFAPLYDMNVAGFEWPYHWALDESGEHLLGMLQRYGPAGLAVNTDAVDPQTMESGGYMEMIEGAKGQYGILDYENWVIMHTCIASGFIPFREHTADEMAKFEENIFKLFEERQEGLGRPGGAGARHDHRRDHRDIPRLGLHRLCRQARRRDPARERRAGGRPGGDKDRRAAEWPGWDCLDRDHIARQQSQPDAAGRGVPDLLSHARGRLQGGCQGAGYAEPCGADGRAGGVKPVLPGRARGPCTGARRAAGWPRWSIAASTSTSTPTTTRCTTSTPRRSALAAPDRHLTVRAVRRPHRRLRIPGAERTMAAAPPILQLRNIVKSFGSLNAVDGVSLDIEEGELFTIVGPSGSGKTTLIRMLVGMDKPTAGDILLRGKADQRRARQQAPDLHGVPVSGAFSAHERRRERRVFGQVQGHRKKERRERAAECLKLSHLPQTYYDKPVTQCSGGERQRVALARALAFNPEIPFFDEPLSAIDYRLRKTLEKELKDIQRETGKTFVYITHSLEEAMVMSDRIGRHARGQALPGRQPSDDLHPAGEPLRHRVHGRGELASGASRR